MNPGIVQTNVSIPRDRETASRDSREGTAWIAEQAAPLPSLLKT